MKILKLDSKIQVGKRLFMPIRISHGDTIYAFNRVKFHPPSPGEYDEVIVYDKDDGIYEQYDACFVGKELKTYRSNPYLDYEIKSINPIPRSKIAVISQLNDMLTEAYGVVQYKPGILMKELSYQKEINEVRRRSSDPDS